MLVHMGGWERMFAQFPSFLASAGFWDPQSRSPPGIYGIILARK